MNTPSAITNLDPVRSAEVAADESLAKFENSMEKLADKVESTTKRIQNVVEDTTLRVQHIVEIAQKPIADIRHLQERARATLAPVYQEIRREPRPWVMTAAFIGAAFLMLRYLERPALKPKHD